MTPNSGFFLTSAVGKTKSQAQNSSQKLKKNTPQAPGGISQKSKKLKKKSQFWSFFKGGGTCFAIFINKYFQLQEFLIQKSLIFEILLIFLQKTSVKKQNSKKKLKLREDFGASRIL